MNLPHSRPMVPQRDASSVEMPHDGRNGRLTKPRQVVGGISISAPTFVFPKGYVDMPVERGSDVPSTETRLSCHGRTPVSPSNGAMSILFVSRSNMEKSYLR